MMRPYDHAKIEKKWQAYWDKKKLNQADDKSEKPKFYGLIEFPFPSGDGLHVGHPRPYIGMDVIARKRRAEGFNVLYPIGWDAFGLPTENYAIKTNTQPAIVTKKNTDNFRRQIKLLAISFDWSREINTTDPKYYKWTQWIFLQLLKHGLAYKKKMAINWCPSCKIGLANEEVIAGECERCGTKVEKREREQWMLAITKYAERLDKDLDTVDYLPQVKLQQRNWIGRSEGTEIDFLLDFKKTPEANKNRGPKGERAAIRVFTTRPDTLFGATYLVLSPEHLWVMLATDDMHDVLENKQEVKNYLEAVRKKSEIERTNEEKEKTGVELKGVKAINPANGEEIPMFVADYVLAGYGTGAIMAVPAHDERDFAFAKKFNLPIREVVEPLVTRVTGEDAFRENEPVSERRAVVAVIKHWSEDKYLGVEWKKTGWKGFVIGGIENGEDAGAAGLREIAEETGYKNVKFVKRLGGKIHARFYQQVKKANRLAHFEPALFQLENGDIAEISAEEKALQDSKWLTPAEFEKFITHADMRIIWDRAQGKECFTGKNSVESGCSIRGLLAHSQKLNGEIIEEAAKKITEAVGGKTVTTFKLRDWVFSRQRYWGEPIPVILCEKCGIVPVPEKDLPVILPKVKEFKPTESGESPLAKAEKWLKVRCPHCKGWARRETDVMPNWAGSSWYYLRYTDPKNSKALADPKRLEYWTPVDWYNGGMEHTTLHLLYSRFWHKFLFDIGSVPTSEPYLKRTSHGLILAEGGVKMSKSKGNVVNPDEIVKLYGADTLRVYEMFMGPFDQAVAWSTESIIGSRRFIERLWRLAEKASLKSDSSKALETLVRKTVAKVSEDIETMRFNTAISALMILLNEMEKESAINSADYKIFLQLAAPFAPHVADELWNILGEKKSIHLAAWPIADKRKIVEEKIRIGVQVNGKVRAELEVSANEGEAEIAKKALESSEIQKWTNGKKIVKTIYVKGRLVNFVVA